MTFSEIEDMAKKSANGQKISSDIKLEIVDHLCMFCLTNLYQKFYSGDVRREDAQPIKAEIQADYELLRQESSFWKSAYAQYQEAIRLASSERERLLLIAKSGSWEMVARLSLIHI